MQVIAKLFGTKANVVDSTATTPPRERLSEKEGELVILDPEDWSFVQSALDTALGGGLIFAQYTRAVLEAVSVAVKRHNAVRGNSHETDISVLRTLVTHVGLSGAKDKATLAQKLVLAVCAGIHIPALHGVISQDHWGLVDPDTLLPRTGGLTLPSWQRQMDLDAELENERQETEQLEAERVEREYINGMRAEEATKKAELERLRKRKHSLVTSAAAKPLVPLPSVAPASGAADLRRCDLPPAVSTTSAVRQAVVSVAEVSVASAAAVRKSAAKPARSTSPPAPPRFPVTSPFAPVASVGAGDDEEASSSEGEDGEDDDGDEELHVAVASDGVFDHSVWSAIKSLPPARRSDALFRAEVALRGRFASVSGRDRLECDLLLSALVLGARCREQQLLELLLNRLWLVSSVGDASVRHHVTEELKGDSLPPHLKSLREAAQKLADRDRKEKKRSGKKGKGKQKKKSGGGAGGGASSSSAASSPSSSSFSGTCHTCQKPGHKASACPTGKSAQA